MNSQDDTFGAMYIGSSVAMALYGLTSLQTYFYFAHYGNDSYDMKALVWLVWILDTVHITFMNHTMYAYLITYIPTPRLRDDGLWSLYASIGVNVLIAFIVQCFFTVRIYHFCSSRFKWWITSSIAFFVFAHFCFGIETVVECFIKKQFNRLKDVEYLAAMPFAITAILSDVLIAGALCTLLDQNRSDFEDTNDIINRLIVFAINRCILTSVVAIVEVIVFCLVPNSLYTFAIDFAIGKLYANSFLATLNSRNALARGFGQGSRSADASTGLNARSLTQPTGVDNTRTTADDTKEHEYTGPDPSDIIELSVQIA